MSALQDQFETDVANIEPDLPFHFIFQGKTYVGSRTEIAGSQELQDAGILLKPSFTLTVRVSQFAQDPPKENDSIIDAETNIQYRINSANDSQEDRVKVYQCVRDN